MAKLVVGPAWDPAANVGPLVTAAHEASVRAYFDVAKAEGARIVAGGSKPAGGVFDAGHYLAPTLIDQVKADIRIAREEVFGPVLTVTTVPDFETALKVTNDVEYGLAACVFTRDIGEALRFVKTAKAGMVQRQPRNRQRGACAVRRRQGIRRRTLFDRPQQSGSSSPT